MTRRKAKDKELWGLFRKSDVEAEYARRLDRVIEACAREAIRFPCPWREAEMRAAVIAAGRKAAGRRR